MKPEVIFHDLDELHSENKWRLLASPTSETAFQFSSQTWLYDVKLSGGTIIELPEMPHENLTALLYVYQGAIEVDQTFALTKQEALVIKNQNISIRTEQGSELVLFITDEKAPIYADGMFSGNQFITK